MYIRFVAFVIFWLLSALGYTQDLIYKKDGTAISCKVLEIKVDVIKYKRIDKKKEPVYEIAKDEAYKIKYKSGLVDVLDKSYDKSTSNLDKFATIYIVYDSKGTKQTFPLYINGRYMCKLEDRSRVIKKHQSEGAVKIYRETFGKYGPSLTVPVLFGKSYGIGIEVVDENASDPKDRFSMVVFQDSIEVKQFVDNVYNGFKPDREHNFQIFEKHQAPPEHE